MCRILFIIHLVPLVLVELFVCRKYGKFWPKWWQTWTKEESGCGRATWPTGQHRPAPPRRRPTPPSANLALCHITDPWEPVQNQLVHWFKSVPTKGHDGVAMDPWANCHRLGASPTDLPAEFWHVLLLQPPLVANHHHWIVRRWNGGPTVPP